MKSGNQGMLERIERVRIIDSMIHESRYSAHYIPNLDISGSPPASLIADWTSF